MAVSKTYLVPIDFSKHSEAALGYALEMARADRGKLLLVHVILNLNVPVPLRRSYEEIMAKGVKLEIDKLVRRNRLKPEEISSRPSLGQRRGGASRGASEEIPSIHDYHG